MNKEIFISDDISQKIQKFDSIIFDCDGVLVDIRNSYDHAINKLYRFYSYGDCCLLKRKGYVK